MDEPRKPPFKVAADTLPTPIAPPKVEADFNIAAGLFAVARAINQLCQVLIALTGEEETRPPVESIEKNEHGRCARCSGTGALGDGAYCTCRLGQDLARLERRRAPEPS